MEAGSILQNAVERIPLVDHEGKSGAALERVLLADGQRLIVKRFSPSTDLVMALTGDTVGREYQLWSRGVLDRLPPQVGHPVVGGTGSAGSVAGGCSARSPLCIRRSSATHLRI